MCIGLTFPAVIFIIFPKRYARAEIGLSSVRLITSSICLASAGRVTHIHMKVHIVDDIEETLQLEYSDSYVAHTGQFFFTEALLDSVYALPPYRSASASPPYSDINFRVCRRR